MKVLRLVYIKNNNNLITFETWDFISLVQFFALIVIYYNIYLCIFTQWVVLNKCMT